MAVAGTVAAAVMVSPTVLPTVSPVAAGMASTDTIGTDPVNSIGTAAAGGSGLAPVHAGVPPLLTAAGFGSATEGFASCGEAAGLTSIARAFLTRRPTGKRYTQKVKQKRAVSSPGLQARGLSPLVTIS